MAFNGILALGKSKKYTDETVAGMGAIKGASCTVKEYEFDVTTGDTIITFAWLDTEGVEHTEEVIVKRGIEGAPGEAGVGIVSIVKTGTVGLVDTYTITYTDGTISTFTVTNGSGGGLPEIINDRYLHTNEETGELEWKKVEAADDTMAKEDPRGIGSFGMNYNGLYGLGDMCFIEGGSNEPCFESIDYMNGFSITYVGRTTESQNCIFSTNIDLTNVEDISEIDIYDDYYTNIEFEVLELDKERNYIICKPRDGLELKSFGWVEDTAVNYHDGDHINNTITYESEDSETVTFVTDMDLSNVDNFDTLEFYIDGEWYSLSVESFDKSNSKIIVEKTSEISDYTEIVDTEITWAGYVFSNYTSNSATGMSSHAEGKNTLANGEAAHAEGNRTVANVSCAHAEGNRTISTNFASHAEGTDTIASGDSSHAEGTDTIASGNYSHAEGEMTTARGYCSHAEGNDTKAENGCSHAEGSYTTASGFASHTEGCDTIASGFASHTEGEGTIANSYCQHVQGKFNIADNDETYAFIIGNGEDSDNLSNAFTVDWSGNTKAAGDVTDGEGNVLSEKADADSVYTQAEVNDLIAAVNQFKIEIVSELPTEDIDTHTIYFVPKGTAGEDDSYNEYIYISNDWELIGSTSIDLGDYYTKDQTDDLLDDKQDSLPEVVNNRYLHTNATTGALEWVAGSGGGSVLADPGDMDIYSADERFVGYWTDGKPLYRKVASNLPANAEFYRKGTFRKGLTYTKGKNLSGPYYGDNTDIFSSTVYSNDYATYKAFDTDPNTSWAPRRMPTEDATPTIGCYFKRARVWGFDLISTKSYSNRIDISTIDIQLLDPSTDNWVTVKTLSPNAKTYTYSNVQLDSQYLLNEYSGFRVVHHTNATNYNWCYVDILRVYELNETYEAEYDVYEYTKTTDSPVTNINTYSTDELLTGQTWIDGKPIYRKVLAIDSVPNSTAKALPLPSNVDNIINWNGFIYSSSNHNNRRPLPFVSGSYKDVIRVDTSGSNTLNIITYDSWAGYTGYMIIEYTKTTD